FLMAAFVAVAILAGRRALSMRTLVVAAALLVLVAPDALIGASMQMSFAAVMALIAGNEVFGGWLSALYRSHGWGGKAAAYVLGLVLTSLLAGSATLPFGAYHFGRVQFYFALSNLVAVPLTGVVVMPAGMLSLALMPLGWERPALVVMGWGIEGVLWIAHTAAALPGATWMAPHMPPWGILVVAFGMIWLSLWRSRLRLVGIAVMLAGLLSPLLERPPDILVSAEARLIAVRTPDGAFVQQISGASKFTREAWLRYWGEPAFRPIPARGTSANGAIDCSQPVCVLRPKAGARSALLVRGLARPDGCGDASVLVAAEPARRLCPRPWPALVDRFTVWRYGAAAIWLNAGRARVLTDRAYRGDRPWVPPVPTPRARIAPGLAPAERDVVAAPAAPLAQQEASGAAMR
ncbi:MAG TPA: ComEC/Rec2 family competence protein, partial [Acetobacteraceae bacterium]|nr:ComEC/Rec2 family competence protein [Acetobacteraceae bacterium]